MNSTQDASCLLSRLQTMNETVSQQLDVCHRAKNSCQLIAVSKQQPTDKVASLLEAGHQNFGENRVQEAMQKWPALKAYYPSVRLHLIGALQSNKVAEAVHLFDMIHSIDRPKIATLLAEQMKIQGRHIPCFIQVNLGEEPQKSGILPYELAGLIDHCRGCDLPVVGLMAIPPEEKNPAPYFALLEKLARHYDLPEKSMGMSDDYLTAIRMGATYVRVGTALFGPRETSRTLI